MNEPKVRSLQEIGAEIRKNWPNPYYGAKPYLEAMKHLDKITDTYIYDSASTVVRYFLANSAQWRGEVARRIKQELRDMLKRAGL